MARGDATSWCPRLGACVFLRDDAGHLLVRKAERVFRIHVAEEVENEFWRVKKYLSGHVTIDEIASRSGVPVDRVRGTIETLEQAGLLAGEINPKTEVPSGAAITSALTRSIDMWRDHMFQHELFQSLERRAAPRQVLIGLALETYHHVAAMPRVLATAISVATQARKVDVLRQLYIEESNHSPLIRTALVRLGVKDFEIGSAQPLSSTLSLLNWKLEMARRNTTAFIAGLSFSEARVEDGWGAKENLRSLARDYDFPETALDPIFEHMAVDLAEGHSRLPWDAIEAEALSLDEADSLTNELHSLKHCYDDYHSGILQYYSDTKETFPPNRLAFADIVR